MMMLLSFSVALTFQVFVEGALNRHVNQNNWGTSKNQFAIRGPVATTSFPKNAAKSLLLRGGGDGETSAADEEVPTAVMPDILDTQPSAELTQSQPTLTPEPTSVPPVASQKKNAKLQNAIERTGPAIVMIFLLSLLIKSTGEKGLIYCLIPLLQLGMYKETTGIIEDHYNKNGLSVGNNNNFDFEIKIEKWWWFLTIFLSTTGRLVLNEMKAASIIPSALSFLSNDDSVNLICYGMVSIGLVMAVVGMASHANASADRFRSYLGEVASFHFVLIFLIGQSSFWIKTIQSFGIAWMLYPALLVVVNDTMAYVFGVLFGKHKLLPRLSPKKTVEGFIGAGISTIGVSIPLMKVFVSFLSKKSDGGDMRSCYEKFISVLIDGMDGSSNNGMSASTLTKHAIVMALYVSIVSPFGGFLASAVKRAHGAKDFGTLIPGHGGVVDRFDCQVVTAPFVFLYLKWFLAQMSN